jgi:hypothetical protein
LRECAKPKQDLSKALVSVTDVDACGLFIHAIHIHQSNSCQDFLFKFREMARDEVAARVVTIVLMILQTKRRELVNNDNNERYHLLVDVIVVVDDVGRTVEVVVVEVIRLLVVGDLALDQSQVNNAT